MTAKNDKNKQNDFLQKAEIAAGAAVVGAAVGATAVALTNPAIKKKVVAGIEKIKDEVVEKRDDLMNKIDKAKEQIADKIK